MSGKRVREMNLGPILQSDRSEAPVRQEAALVGDSEEPPGSRSQFDSPRHAAWRNVPLSDWEDWRWQMQHAVRTTRHLAELLPLPADKLADLERLESQYKLVIPPYYLSLIQADDPYADPIGLQALPHVAETTVDSSVERQDPLDEDKDSPVPGLTHRYPDRVLLVSTPVCSMYCRFCTRKRVTMDRDGWDAPSRDEERMIEYIAAHPEIHDCILSGGDALMLSETKLRWYLTQLAAIPHVDVIRVGTRVPVTLPQKLFDERLIALLAETGKVWVQTHFNHPREITAEAARGCRNLVNSGLPINNHAVLLKGVNDSVETMRALMRGLLRIKVRPYYLFHCDPVVGAGHFRTSVWKGLEIMEGLRGHMSGLGVPTYVVDGLHGAGKIPLMPNYLVSASPDAVVLRNYEGMLFRYAPEDRTSPAVAPIATTGVSELLSGSGEKLMPEGNARMKRRRATTTSAETAIVEGPVTVQGSRRARAAAKSMVDVLAAARQADGKKSNEAKSESAVAQRKRAAAPKPAARARRATTPQPFAILPADSDGWSGPEGSAIHVLSNAEK